MTSEELKYFAENIANPIMKKVFENTEIKDGACYIDNITISFLDGRNCGFDSRIEASGYSYIDGKAEKFTYDEMDVKLSDFVKENMIFISEGNVHIIDEMMNVDLRTDFQNFSNVRGCFFWLNDEPKLDSKLFCIEYEKTKNMVEEEMTDENSMDTMSI